MMLNRFAPLALFVAFAVLASCGVKNDLSDPPVPLGDFVLGHNIVIAKNVQKVPISREATPQEWETSMKKAMAARFGRYEGKRIYNIGIAVDAYALAPPGVPVLLAPKSVLAITANIWDDARAQKLNAEGEKFTIFEGMSGDTVVGSGLTRSKEQQMQQLSYNAAKRVETWLLEHPEWFGMTKAELTTALAARDAALAETADAARATAKQKTQAKPAKAAPSP